MKYISIVNRFITKNITSLLMEDVDEVIGILRSFANENGMVEEVICKDERIIDIRFFAGRNDIFKAGMCLKLYTNNLEYIWLVDINESKINIDLNKLIKKIKKQTPDLLIVINNREYLNIKILPK